MDTQAPAPPTEAARQYLAIRKLSMALTSKLIGMKGTVHPFTAARALGIPVHGKTICFDGGWELSLLTEYTLFHHVSKGKRFFQHALVEADDLSPVEREILMCHQKAFTSVFEIEESRPDVWEVDLHDVLGERGRVTVIDRNFSQFQMAGGLLYSRLIPHEQYTATSGAGLPLLAPGTDKETKETVLRYCQQAIANPGKRTRQQALLYTCRKLHLQFGPEIQYE
ncbi:MAG: hypothetical protein O3C43_22355 [Verrucomicrobia bacterium]|nr:hypothetical protein [Verrucomicrobiota bacterium]MDA1069235.1 hypothetical protein [Verrucomicrobiota bacterium]